MELINLAGLLLLALLIRKLVWCLRWLWCYYHGRETVAGPADPQAGLVPAVAVVLLPRPGDAGAHLLSAPADGRDL